MNHKGTQVLETDRLILRPFRIEDAENMYHNWASDPEVTRFLTWPPHKSTDMTRAFLASVISQYDDPACYCWAIELKDSHELVGNISVVRTREDIASMDIGYCMGKAWWGKEIMPEALKRVITFLFEEVGVNRIAASHDVNNPKSGRVMDKAGMTQEGIWRAGDLNNQGVCDSVWHSILKSEYQS